MFSFLLINSLMKDNFFKPPINKISLNFLERSLENAYRSSYKEEVHTQTHTVPVSVIITHITAKLVSDKALHFMPH